MAKVIADAHASRFKAGKNEQDRDFIMANDDWIHELTAHPYISSKIIFFILIERPGTAIYLMKQRSKLVRAKKETKKYPLS